jgi:hypothetical protein
MTRIMQGTQERLKNGLKTELVRENYKTENENRG